MKIINVTAKEKEWEKEKAELVEMMTKILRGSKHGANNDDDWHIRVYWDDVKKVSELISKHTNEHQRESRIEGVCRNLKI